MLILTAGMGGGHLGAASELSRRLVIAGYDAPVVDLLQMMRFGYGRLITDIYHAQLRYAPWIYQGIYSLWRTHPELVRAANGADTRMARRNLLASVARTRPMAIVSAYNLGAQVLGELAADGSSAVPVYSFVTDFGVHPYWIHDAMDGYLVVHESSAQHVQSLSEAPVVVCGPLVAPAFTADPGLSADDHSGRDERRSVRESLGLGDRDTAALVVAGAWGVGDVEKTVRELSLIDGCVPIAVCGRNAKLAARLRRNAGNVGRVIGFTDAMPGLMQAADLLVENAGGLTTFEAFASGLPVITYRPIPAHGIDNANAMATAGVTTFARTANELATAVNTLGNNSAVRTQQVMAGRAVFPPDPTSTILGLINPVSDQHGSGSRLASEPNSRIQQKWSSEARSPEERSQQ